MSDKSYDLVVIGSGAGLSVLDAGLQRGLKCALVESGKMGGTCLTRGCIPSKILVYPADVIRQAEQARMIGVELTLNRIDWELISRRMWKKIDYSKQLEKSLATAAGLTVYRGTGEFTGKFRMRVRFDDGAEPEEFTSKKFVVATGARSAVPPIPGLKEASYVTSESFFGEKFPAKPWKSLVIIGGGIIAAEFAHIFSAFGTEVTIIEMMPRLLTSEEPDVSSLIERAFRKRMDVRLNAKAVAVRAESETKYVTYEAVKNGERGEVGAEEILVAVGRRSNADLLRVEETGVETDNNGWIRANEYLETSQPGIWAIGDALGGFQFRHKANYDSDILVHNMFSEPAKRIPTDYSAVPWAVYTDPQVGHVGMTEKEALDAGHEIYVAVHRYSDVAKGFAMGFEPDDPDAGFVKLVIDKSYKILGAHVVGPYAAILVQPFVYLMNAGYTCAPPEKGAPSIIPRAERACPEAGSVMPIYRSMVIHPSLNEVTGWAIGALRPVNIKS